MVQCGCLPFETCFLCRGADPQEAKPMTEHTTVGELIAALSNFDDDKPVRIRNAYVRDDVWYHEVDPILAEDEKGVVIDLGDVI